jgi:Protein phosphatase 2C
VSEATAYVRLDVVDRWSEPGAACNEDAIGATPSAAWVIDGTKGPFDHKLTPGPTDAAWHAQTLNAILCESYADAAGDPAASLARAAARLSAAYAREAVDVPSHQQPSACLALAAAGASRTLHLFNIGDCRVLIDRGGAVRNFGSSGIERLETAALDELVRLRGAMGEAGDPWPQLRETLRRNFEVAMNKPGGYWVVHPSLHWLHAVQHEEVPAHEVDHVLIASDGFFRLVNVFRAYDACGLVAAALRGEGLAALCAELRAREAEDPTCRRHPRLKPSDDASAVLVRVATTRSRCNAQSRQGQGATSSSQ